MSKALPLSQIEKSLMDQVGEVSREVLDQLMGLILAARAHPGQLTCQKKEAADNIEPILAKKFISLPGHGTVQDEAERLVEIAVRYI